MALLKSGARLRHGRVLPVSPGVPYTKDLDVLTIPAIHDKVRGIRHNPLPSTADVTLPTKIGMVEELRSRIPDTLRHLLGGERIFPGDVLLRFDKV